GQVGAVGEGEVEDGVEAFSAGVEVGRVPDGVGGVDVGAGLDEGAGGVGGAVLGGFDERGALVGSAGFDIGAAGEQIADSVGVVGRGGGQQVVVEGGVVWWGGRRFGGCRGRGRGLL